MSHLNHTNKVLTPEEEPEHPTLIRVKIKESGRMIRWYADKLGYAYRLSGGAFYCIVRGQKVPQSPEKRRLLAYLLGCKPRDLWELNDTGHLVARREWVSENQHFKQEGEWGVGY